MKHFKAIAAMSMNRVIGRGGQIPWRLSGDFKWFKRVTTGQVIVMGRKTFESIGRPLPDRTTVVLTHSKTPIPGVLTVSDLSEIDPSKEIRDVFICGGAELYRQGLPLCSDLYLTVVNRVVEGDVFFPPFEDRFEFAATLLEEPEFRVLHYLNRLVGAGQYHSDSRSSSVQAHLASGGAADSV